MGEMETGGVAAAERIGTHHDADLYSWVEEQVALLRAGRLSEIDALNIAEELADLGKSEYRALESAIAVVVQHLLKWDHQPDKRSHSWVYTIAEHRYRVGQLLDDNPGMKPRLQQAVDAGYTVGRFRALAETGLPRTSLPEHCPFTFEQLMERPIEPLGDPSS